MLYLVKKDFLNYKKFQILSINIEHLIENNGFQADSEMIKHLIFNNYIKPINCKGDLVAISSRAFNCKKYQNNNHNVIVKIINYKEDMLVGKDIFSGQIGVFYPENIISKSKMYWFFDSKGNIRTDYAFRNIQTDINRIMLNNMFNSHAKVVDYYNSKFHKLIDEHEHIESSITLIKDTINV